MQPEVAFSKLILVLYSAKSFLHQDEASLLTNLLSRGKVVP
jgi:hypothetical protein